MPYTFYIRRGNLLAEIEQVYFIAQIEPGYFIDILMNHDILEAQNNY